MENILEALQYAIPSLVVGAAAILVVKAFIEKETRAQKHEYILKNQKTNYSYQVTSL
jgi:predicted ABC-type sugar transport system permease subunit